METGPGSELGLGPLGPPDPEMEANEEGTLRSMGWESSKLASALEGVGVRRVATEMGQAWGDWQQESGSHRLDPVPEWSLSVFLGRWGRFSHWERQPSSRLLPVSLCLSLFLCLCLSSCPPSPSLCVSVSRLLSLCISLSLSISVSVESMRTLDLTGVFPHRKGGSGALGAP